MICLKMNCIKCMAGILVAVMICGCGEHLSIVGTAVKGSGNVVDEEREVSGFSGVRIDGSGNVRIELSESESLVVSADDNILPYLTTEVVDSELVLGVKPNTSIQPSQEIVYQITAQELTRIAIRGSGDVVATDIDSDELSSSISGSGNISVAGSSNRQNVQISGSGDYDGSKLTSQSAAVSISGSGDAVVNATDELDARISGSGTVEYLGKPRVTQDISGSGKVRAR